MQNAKHAAQAYRTALHYRSQRQQEADVFYHANAAMRGAKGAGEVQQVRALADNRRLWLMVSNLLRDPENSLPDALKASILSVGIAVQREMDKKTLDFDFLIAINEEIAAGLAGKP